MRVLDFDCIRVCAREEGKTRGRANGENIRPIFRDRGDLCTPATIWGRLYIRVYQILSPTKLCIWVDTLFSSMEWVYIEFTLEREIVSYRSSSSSFLPSFFSSRGNFSHETYLVRFVANPKSFRIHHPKFCLPSVFFLSIRKKGERERESWKREIFFNWYHVACINIVRVNHKYLTICSFDERMIHKHAEFFLLLFLLFLVSGRGE